MKIRVCKFGGTCLTESEDRVRVADHLERLVADGQRLVIVVSAMGRRGSPYATDTLIGLLGEHREHLPPRELDRLMGVGETISVALLTAVLRGRGLDAVGCSGAEAGIHTDGCHGRAHIRGVEIQRLRDLLDRHVVVVVAGFQGQGPDGALTTLGRGGSDLSAVALAAALGLEEVDIFTDVAGVFTADPRTVPGARPIREMNAEDVRQMAWQGARVLHPRAAEMAAEQGVAVNVQAAGDQGRTRIHPRPGVRECRHVTAVASDGPVHLLEVALSEKGVSTVEATRVFSAIADAGISADMIGISSGGIRFNVPQEKGAQAEEILTELGYRIVTRAGCARVSIVGAGIHGVPGIMARFCDALQSVSVTILQSVDSHATISALIPGQQRAAAEKALHETFIERSGC